MLKYTIILGLNDQKTKKQEISTEEAYRIIFEILQNNGIEGATLTEATGFYVHDDGTRVIEKSIKTELLFIEKSTAMDIAQIFRKEFNQEEVILEITELESDVIRKN